MFRQAPTISICVTMNLLLVKHDFTQLLPEPNSQEVPDEIDENCESGNGDYQKE